MNMENESKGRAINLLQITDCHLTKDKASDLLGVVTRDSLDAVLALVNSNIKNKVHAAPDFMVASGDIAQDASPQAYQYFRYQTKSLCERSGWFSGNHDDTNAMLGSLTDQSMFSKVYRFDHWQIILLDSSVSGSVHGLLKPNELKILERALAEAPNLNTLVCLHHHPLEIGSDWLDKIGLHNRDEFFAIIDRFDNVRGVLWGHIHQTWDSTRQGIPMMASPSTCIQFMPKSAGFAVEDIAPGYRSLCLHADGRIDTAVYRAEDFQFNLDLKSTGY